MATGIVQNSRGSAGAASMSNDPRQRLIMGMAMRNAVRSPGIGAPQGSSGLGS